MIYTITLNPAYDHIVIVDDLVLNKTDYSKESYYTIGGKGINVSIMLSRLKIKSTALGFLAIDNNSYFLKQLKLLKINNDFINVPGMIRTNIKITSSDQSTEINGLGPEIDEENWKLLLQKIKAIKNDDYVFVSGKPSRSITSDQIELLILMIKRQTKKLIIDMNDEYLKLSLKHQPLLIKPNIYELETIFNVTNIHSEEAIINYCKKLQSLGAKNVLLSLGEKGSYFFNEDSSIYYINTAKGKVIHPVGAGDSMLAFFAGEFFIKQKSIKWALKYAAAAGAATAFNYELAKMTEIKVLVSQIRVKEIRR